MFLRFLNFSPRVMPILTANCFIVFMKITQVQPCIPWKTTPVANPLHKRARTLKHSQTPQCPRFIRAPPYPSTCQRFHRPQIPHQYHANTAPAPHPLTIRPNPAKSLVVSKRVCPQRPKTAESYPHPLTNERNLPESQDASERGYLTATKTTDRTQNRNTIRMM